MNRHYAREGGECAPPHSPKRRRARSFCLLLRKWSRPNRIKLSFIYLRFFQVGTSFGGTRVLLLHLAATAKSEKQMRRKKSPTRTRLSSADAPFSGENGSLAASRVKGRRELPSLKDRSRMGETKSFLGQGRRSFGRKRYGIAILCSRSFLP